MQQLGPSEEGLNKICFIHHYEINSKKQLDYLIFQKVANFLKNPSSPEEGLDKISLLAFRLREFPCDVTFMFAQSLRAAWPFMAKIC